MENHVTVKSCRTKKKPRSTNMCIHNNRTDITRLTISN